MSTSSLGGLLHLKSSPESSSTVASRPTTSRDVYDGIQYRCHQRSSSWYPAQNTGWNNVVATWQMPPATLGTVCAPPLPPVVRPKPHWKPDSSVVGHTSTLKDNVAPCGTTVPVMR